MQPIRILSTNQMQQIHDAALTILAEVGMRVESDRARAYYEAAGCTVRTSPPIVTFPRPIVQAAVDQMRRDYGNADRLPASMAVRYSHIRFRREEHRIHPDYTVSTGGFCCYIFGPDGVRRSADMDDVLKSINLVNNIDEISFTGLPVADQMTPIELRPVKMAAELAKHTHKLGGIETFKPDDIPYLIEIGSVISGGEEKLKTRPILVGYGEARSPLCFDANMAEIFVEYIERGYPQTLDTMPNGGATAPMTAAGNLSIGIAETLAAVVLAYAIRPDPIVGVDIIPSNCDMRTGLFRYAGADRIPLLIGRVQLISEYYGCPSGVHGAKTDGCRADLRTGVEKAATTIFPVLAGAVGIGTAGHLENAVTFSPVQLVIDSEISRYVRRSLRPIEVNDETLALDAIRRVGPGGNFLEDPHTLSHFRSESFLSPFFPAEPWEQAVRDGAEITEQAAAFVRENWVLPDPVLDEKTIREIDSIVDAAAGSLM